MKRHVAAVPLPEKKAIREFHEYTDEVFSQLREHLDDFDYSYSQWFNHLNARQQNDVESGNFESDENNKACSYEMFCKREVQIIDEGTYPKNRAIAGPKGYDKFVLGPVTWKLEYLFDKHLDGYCGGKNWDDLEKFLSDSYKEGYTYIAQGDGSGFDRTQSHELKYFDRLVYDYIAEKTHHVDPEIFKTKASSRHRVINGNVMIRGKQLLCKALVDATVTSGSPDTTLMNTARMSLYLGFMIKKAGIDAKKLAKGDDFIILLKNAGDFDKLKVQFDNYWAPKNKYLNEEYGLGLIIKFLQFGKYEIFDFCSTHLICDYKNAKFKIVRQWERVKKLGAYSIKALSMSKNQKNQYVSDSIVGMKKWTNDMPFYTQYMEELGKMYEGPKSKIVLEGKGKKILKYDGHELIPTKNLLIKTGYGRDVDYALQFRTSTTKMEDEIVKRFFYEKYGLTWSEKPWRIM